jgi:catechol 2,3-dioxygenase-like lactoylglutathione lyase family enzyme
VTIERMDHVGVVVDDLAAAIDFFVALGLEVTGRRSVEGEWVDRVIGLEGARSDLAFVQTPDGHSRLELVEFHAPPYAGKRSLEPSNAPGIRHLTFAVDDLDAVLSNIRDHGAELVGEVQNYENVYKLCYVRGPAGIILELAEKLA